MTRYTLNTIFFIFIDILFLIVIFYLSEYMRASISLSILPTFDKINLQKFSFVIFIIIWLMYLEKIYTLHYDFWQETKHIFRAFFLAYLFVFALLTLLKTSLDYSRTFITLYFLLSFTCIPIMKRFVKKQIYKLTYFRKKILIVGSKKQANIFKEEIQKNWYLGLEYDVYNYDTVIIASKGLSKDKINKKITKYLANNSSVYIVPYVTQINFASSNIMEYSNIRFNTIQIENKLLLKRNILLKRLFDYLFTLMILPIFTLLHILISLVIKFDSKGSIFFKQHRLGQNDNDFLCFKYRTMREDSDVLLTKYLQENPLEIEYYEKYHKYMNDPRITKVGKFLRSTSLDELPQVINVLKGEMSLIGPRPYMLKESYKIGDIQEFILKVKPGITGLWQVSGRNNLTFKQRNKLEVWYIKNWSLWDDFVILIKTLKVVLTKLGAK